MILSDSEIYDWGIAGGIRPFNSACVNPASIDLRWSGYYKIANRPSVIKTLLYKAARLLGVAKDYRKRFENMSLWSEEFYGDSLVMEPGKFYLMDTLERVIMPKDCVGKLFLKSSAGRMGIEHLHAGYVDPGFVGTLTLELETRVPWPITIHRGQKIMQMTLEKMSKRPVVSYAKTGRYNNQVGPTESKGL